MVRDLDPASARFKLVNSARSVVISVLPRDDRPAVVVRRVCQLAVFVGHVEHDVSRLLARVHRCVSERVVLFLLDVVQKSVRRLQLLLKRGDLLEQFRRLDFLDLRNNSWLGWLRVRGCSANAEAGEQGDDDSEDPRPAARLTGVFAEPWVRDLDGG